MDFRPKIHLPVDLLIPLASIVEWVNQRFPASAPSQFTPSRLRLVTSWRTFNCDRATRLLGYSPIVSLEVCFINLYQFIDVFL
jgi:nucleoside-diphosphate-sugar epimerase